ncbi:MAG: hypothetical protein Q9224_001409 [Gallowayella concinna]
MQYVQTLAEVPTNPFEHKHRILSSEVLSSHGVSKKKRSEIALAVNNHSIGIYNIRSGVIVASYAVSPMTTFTCPPCSTKLLKNGQGESRSITYCSIVDPRPKILCFSEESRNSTNYDAKLTKSYFDLPEHGVPIVHIDVLSTPSGDTTTTILDILCVHQDGRVSCYDENLTRRTWGPQAATARNSQMAPKELQVIQASSVSIAQARKTILKDHQDVLGLLDANPGNFTADLLLLLTRSVQDSQTSTQRELTLRVLAIKSLQSIESEFRRSKDDRIEEIVSLKIPEPEGVRGKEGLFSIHTSSGSLYHGTSGLLSIYDLTALTPRLVRTMTLDGSHNALSYVRISSNIIATVSENSLEILDTQFNSFRAKYDLTLPKKKPPKAPRDGAKTPGPLPRDAELLTYHSPSRSAIVLLGRSLLSVDLSLSIEPRSSSRKRKRNGLLIDAIGRGSLAEDTKQPPPKRRSGPSLALGSFVGSHGGNEEWSKKEEALNALLENGDHLAFDRAVTSELDNIDRPLEGGAVASYTPEHKVDYVFSKMFSTEGCGWTNQKRINIGIRLHIKSFNQQAWRYLVQKGLVSSERLEASFKRRGLMEGNNVLQEGELIRALVDWDQSLDSLLFLLQSPCLIHTSEICYALKTTIARFSMLAAPDGLKLLDYGDEPISQHLDSGDDTNLANADPSIPPQRASVDSNHLHTLFDMIVARCDACPARAMTKALKAQLSKNELQKLIILLRTKLRQDGWLSPYTEDGLTVSLERQHHDREISMIGKLLNCVVDGLGTGGWLLNNGVADDGTEAVETVTNMQAEISTALEGVWEANYLRGLLGELLLCGKGALARTRPKADWRNASSKALPLGLKVVQDVSLTRVGAGGELQKRSRRDIGKLKSRRVPEYSFERIAI